MKEKETELIDNKEIIKQSSKLSIRNHLPCSQQSSSLLVL